MANKIIVSCMVCLKWAYTNTWILVQNNQVDWEALLQQTPELFMKSLDWLVQPALTSINKSSDSNATSTSTSEAQIEAESQSETNGIKETEASKASDSSSSMRSLPSVKDLLPTLRNRLEALNGPSMHRLWEIISCVIFDNEITAFCHRFWIRADLDGFVCSSR